MSIDELGRGLVNESRKVRRRQRKKQERYAQRAALAQIALPIGARIIEDGLMQKAQDFFQSEEVLNLKRQHDNAIKESNNLFATEEAISMTNLTPEDWRYNQVLPVVQEEMVSEAKRLEQEQGVNLTGTHVERGHILNQELIGLIEEQARSIANEWGVQYREGLEAAKKVVGAEEFDSMVASKIKNTTPTNIVDMVGRKISTLFGGTSTSERQQLALNAIRNHHFSTSADALATFDEKYDETKNIRTALDWGNLVKDIRICS